MLFLPLSLTGTSGGTWNRRLGKPVTLIKNERGSGVDRLLTFDHAALVGASHRRAVRLIVERAVEIAQGKASPIIALVVSERGGGKTHLPQTATTRSDEPDRDPMG